MGIVVHELLGEPRLGANAIHFSMGRDRGSSSTVAVQRKPSQGPQAAEKLAWHVLFQRELLM